MSGFTVRPLTPPLYSLGAGYFSPKLREVARKIPGLEWKGAYRAIVGHIDAIECAAGTLKAMGLRVDDGAIENIKPDDYSHNLPASYARSRDYQKTGIDFLIANGVAGALLADDCSLGKGHQSLRAARAFRHRTLIVCPAHVRGVWERLPGLGDDEGGEVCKWWPEAHKKGILAPYGVTPEPLNPDALVCIIHYDILYAWVDAIREWGPETGILDEGHVAQGQESRRSDALRAVMEGCRVRMALTGTPPTDYPKDFWNLLDILSPGRFGKFFDWGRRYCGGFQEEIKIAGGTTRTVWNFKGKSNTDELRRRLHWMTLRREKSDVAKEMPPQTRQIVDVTVKPNARHMPNFHYFKKTAAIRKSLDLAADAKFPHVLNLIRGHLREGKKVVAFTWRKEIAEKIVGQCSDVASVAEFIHSGVSQSKRSLHIQRVKQATGAALLTGTIDSCGTGIDLSFAYVGVFAELHYVPRVLLQAEGRLHRIGVLESVLIQYVIARGTTDELIQAAVIRKLSMRDALIGEGADGLKDDLSAGDETEEEAMGRLSDALRAMGEPNKPQRKRSA